jgi:GWxTD domain-containing protein
MIRTLRRSIVLCSLVAATALAQAPVGADTISDSAVADSQAVLAQMATAIRTNKRDAASWFRQGVVAWVISVRLEGRPFKGLDRFKLRRMADTSLLIATQLDAKNVHYHLTTGEFLRSSTEFGPRLRGAQYFDESLALARASGDSAVLSRAIIAVARMRWLSYEDRVNQILWADPAMMTQSGSVGSGAGIAKAGTSDTIGRGYNPGFLVNDPDMKTTCESLTESVDAAMNRGTKSPSATAVAGSKRLHNEIVDCLRNRGPLDLGDYTRAEGLFREAYARAPREPRAFRQLAMLLADRNRWNELAAAARDRTTRAPAEAWGWLTLGLALHRTADAKGSSAAFDRGLATLDERERGRLFSFEKLMSRQDSITSVTLASDRGERETAVWQFLDPLWSRQTNDPQTEFLARVVYAEIRWTAEEMAMRGADSDRGEIYIRFGPPNRM